MDDADKPKVPSRADLALLRRAARERWGVPTELMTEAIAAAWEILADADAKPKLKLAALRMLVAFDRADQSNEKLELEKSKLAKPDVADARSALLYEALEICEGDDDPGGTPADGPGPPGVPP